MNNNLDENDKKIHEMIKNGEAKTLSPEAFERLINAINEPANPSQELIDLLRSEKHYTLR